MPKKEFPNIPGYRIEKIIGEGGMAVVYLAIQTALDRKVALKVTLPALAEIDPSFTRRFVREARATAALNHQNIITVYDAGVFEQSSYMAMEYISTGTLADLDRSSLSDREICKLFIGICKGLRTAHKAGFVHRDIKPDNILIDAQGMPVVTDFGIVKSTRANNTAITIAGGTIGTPQYMSPEQIKAEDLDGRSDLYSIGVMLFNILEGHAPFVDPTPSAVYIMHVTTDPPPLSEQNTIFQPVISCLLEKDPNDRYKDANELIIAFKNIKVDSNNRKPRIKEAKGIPVRDRSNSPQASSVVKKQVKPKATNQKSPTTEETIINNKHTVLKQTKAVPVTKTYISTGTQYNYKKSNTKLIAAAAAVVLLVSSYFLFSQKESNQGNIKPESVIQTNPNLEKEKNLADKNDWLKALKNNTEHSFSTYIAEHPQGIYLILAERNIKEKIKQNLEIKEQNLSAKTENLEAEDKDIEQQEKIKELTESKSDDKFTSDDLITNPIGQNTLDQNPKEESLTSSGIEIDTERVAFVGVDSALQNGNEGQLGIKELLMLSENDIKNLKLLRPAGDNAFEKLNKILELDSENNRAKTLLLEIAHNYLVLSKNNSNSNNYKMALTYINNAIKIREGYLAKGYDKNDFLGVSDSISLPKLELIKIKLTSSLEQIVIAANLKKEQIELQKQQDLTRNQEQEKKQTNPITDSYNRGKKAYESGDFKNAEKWYLKAASQNHALAQDKLGSLYFQGKGVRKDLSKAVDWYLKAANQNLASAQDHMGLMCYKGYGVNRNYKKAFEWFKKAGEQNFSEGQWNLGVMYENGRGVKKNPKKAIKWYKKAALQGNNDAIKRLKEYGVNY